ncbi:hypothetical protein M885DRAFT_524404 [Pelagophyceae sp. CCMP2097]|nr:hypothetical protein M885DRAFT_524404 [Pelagophyceae sp. CCMP2097]
MFKKRDRKGAARSKAAEADGAADGADDEGAANLGHLRELKEDQAARRRGLGTSADDLIAAGDRAKQLDKKAKMSPEDAMVVQTLEKQMSNQYTAETGDVKSRMMQEKAMEEFISKKLGRADGAAAAAAEVITDEDRLYIVQPLIYTKDEASETGTGVSVTAGLTEHTLSAKSAQRNAERTKAAVEEALRRKNSLPVSSAMPVPAPRQ